jgi:hypothetical protein
LNVFVSSASTDEIQVARRNALRSGVQVPGATLRSSCWTLGYETVYVLLARCTTIFGNFALDENVQRLNEIKHQLAALQCHNKRQGTATGDAHTSFAYDSADEYGWQRLQED